jgi:hypothetical protein
VYLVMRGGEDVAMTVPEHLKVDPGLPCVDCPHRGHIELHQAMLSIHQPQDLFAKLTPHH